MVSNIGSRESWWRWRRRLESAKFTLFARDIDLVKLAVCDVNNVFNKKKENMVIRCERAKAAIEVFFNSVQIRQQTSVTLNDSTHS